MSKMPRTTTVELTDRDMLKIIETLADECSRNRMPMSGENLAICGKLLPARRAAAPDGSARVQAAARSVRRGGA